MSAKKNPPDHMKLVEPTETLTEKTKKAIEAAKPENGVDLAEELVAHLRRYLSILTDEAVIVVTWIFYAHSWEKFARTPYLAISSAERMSGKTTLMRWIRLLVPRPLTTAAISPAALYRTIPKTKPIMLIDELDTIFSNKPGKVDSERAETFRMVLNAGYERGNPVIVCAKGGGGIAQFDVYCPKVLAGIGALPDTIQSRCIPIMMQRRAGDETIERLDDEEPDAKFAELKSRVERWTIQSADAIDKAKANFPEALSDRGRDISKALFRIGTVIGSDWLAALEKALVTLLRPRAEDATLGQQLLADIKATFEDQRATVLSARQLTDGLLAMDGVQPWSDFYGKPITPTRVAKMLKHFSIVPKYFRVGSGRTYGYARGQFLDAWARYLVPISAEEAEGIEPPGLPLFEE